MTGEWQRIKHSRKETGITYIMKKSCTLCPQFDTQTFCTLMILLPFVQGPSALGDFICEGFKYLKLGSFSITLLKSMQNFHAVLQQSLLQNNCVPWDAVLFTKLSVINSPWLMQNRGRKIQPIQEINAKLREESSANTREGISGFRAGVPQVQQPQHRVKQGFRQIHPTKPSCKTPPKLPQCLRGVPWDGELGRINTQKSKFQPYCWACWFSTTFLGRIACWAQIWMGLCWDEGLCLMLLEPLPWDLLHHHKLLPVLDKGMGHCHWHPPRWCAKFLCP